MEKSISKVSTEIARKEVDKWLDAKRIPLKRRIENQVFIDNLIEGVEEGNLIVNEDNSLTQKLAFPIENENGQVVCEVLNYKFRITENDKLKYRKSLQKDDNSFMLTLMALTDAPRGHLTALDSSVDKTLADTIALFFL
jgi:hypothetical protein